MLEYQVYASYSIDPIAQLAGALPRRQQRLVGPYTLRVSFSDNSQQVINFEPVLHGEMYAPLRNLHFFNQVRLDPEIRTLVWSNGADFDPYVLHEWPRVVEQIARRLQAAAVAPLG